MPMNEMQACVYGCDVVISVVIVFVLNEKKKKNLSLGKKNIPMYRENSFFTG